MVKSEDDKTMLNFRLRYVVAYIENSGVDIEKAAAEFFGDYEFDSELLDNEGISSLFNEWLIFDYKLPSGLTITADYYLKNPDNFSKNLMDELKQIIETQVYEFLEVIEAKPGKWLEVHGLFSGKRYRVREKSLSWQIGKRLGCFFNRIAKVDGDYYFIGSNPKVLPITYTDRSKRFFRQSDKTLLSPKNALMNLLPSKDKNKDLEYVQTTGGVEKKRRELEKEFDKLRRKYRLNISFDALTRFVFNENYRSHFADFYKDILKTGVPEEMAFESVKFFQDLWNFFPHKKLGGKSPAERYKEAYGG